MTGVEIWLFIAQASSIITFVIGLFAFGSLIKASLHLDEGWYKSMFIALSGTILLIVIGVASMALYHLSESFDKLAELGEIVELGWYTFTFAGLCYSMYASYRVINYLKKFSRFNVKNSKKIKSL